MAIVTILVLDVVGPAFILRGSRGTVNSEPGFAYLFISACQAVSCQEIGVNGATPVKREGEFLGACGNCKPLGFFPVVPAALRNSL